jgi:hypothetical protein
MTFMKSLNQNKYQPYIDERVLEAGCGSSIVTHAVGIIGAEPSVLASCPMSALPQ